MNSRIIKKSCLRKKNSTNKSNQNFEKIGANSVYIKDIRRVMKSIYDKFDLKNKK